MQWLNFLHLYQPANQQKDILASVVQQSYRPLINYIYNNNKVNLTINITGSLLELFDRDGYYDLIEMLKDSVFKGKIEITGSAKYHAILPLITKREIERQIVANDETLRKYLGNNVVTKGFFAPEMAVNQELMPIISSLGYEWIVLDEISYNGGNKYPNSTSLYVDKHSGVTFFFRNRRISTLIMSAFASGTET